MAVQLSPMPEFFWQTPQGQPAAGYLLNTYIAGTSTPQATYTDSTGLVQNTNPVVLNSYGFASVWLNTSQVYKFVLTDPNGNVVWTQDQIPGGFGSSAIGTNLLPAITNTYNVGSPTFTWANGYFGTALYIGGVSVFTQQTAAEIAATVTPTALQYVEGDIRRYGATTGSSDNHAAINNALLVSGAGGSYALIPGGTWNITTTITAAAKSSMRGVGNASIIAANGCDGITFANYGNYAVTGMAYRFSDFQIVGNNSTNSTNNGIICNLTVVSGSVVNGVLFQNLWIQNFGFAVYMRGFYRCVFDKVQGYNNYQGFYQFGQNVNIEIINCHMIRAGMTGSGQAFGYSVQATSSGESGSVDTQSVQIAHCLFYNYDININIIFGFEIQVEHCDLSNAQSVGVAITTTVGGIWIRDCWIETNVNAITTGVQINSIGTINYQDIHIVGNHITCDQAFVGSTGVSMASAQYGVTVDDNYINGFDIGVFNLAVNNCSIKRNRINILTSVYSASSLAVSLNSSSADNEVGPNAIIPGNTPVNPTFFQAATMANASANIGVTNSAKFPVGTPVQFDASQNGALAGVTYYVLTSAANVLTLTNIPSGVVLPNWTGNTAVNIFAAPLPVAFNSGTPPGFSLYARGSFIGTLSGLTTTPSGQIDWVANGKLVSLNVNDAVSLTGTSNATTMALLGLPPMLAPPSGRVQQTLAAVENSGTFTYGAAIITAAAGITFLPGPAGGNFGATGGKGVNTQPIVYQYN